jgi:transposase, IS30 family
MGIEVDVGPLEGLSSKRTQGKIDLNPSLKRYIYKGLLNNWSPEQISGRIKKDFPNDQIMCISLGGLIL